MVGVVRGMGVVEDKGSVAVDRLRNTVPCAPGPGIGVVTAMVAAASRGWTFPGWLERHPSNNRFVGATYIGNARVRQVLLGRAQPAGSLHG